MTYACKSAGVPGISTPCQWAKSPTKAGIPRWGGSTPQTRLFLPNLVPQSAKDEQRLVNTGLEIDGRHRRGMSAEARYSCFDGATGRAALTDSTPVSVSVLICACTLRPKSTNVWLQGNGGTHVGLAQDKQQSRRPRSNPHVVSTR